MFTLKLKEIELTPRIEEDKSFSNKNKFELEREVKMYIQEKYADVYMNPLTIGRKVSDAIRDEKGETLDDQIERERKERDIRFDASEKIRAEIGDEVKAKYAQEFESMEEERDKEIHALYDEYRPKIDALNEEGKKDEVKAIEEERSVKEDDILYKNSQKQSALMDKRFAEEKEKINVALNK